MRHREIDRGRAELLCAFGEAPREPHRRLRAPDDLDLLPGECPRDAEPERLAHGFLAREASGIALRRVRAGVAVRTLGLGEAALAETSVTLQRVPDPLDLDQVRTHMDAHTR